jgi:hypothetical protein
VTPDEEASQTGSTVPNNWAPAGDRNPYLHNVFTLLQVDPDRLGVLIDSGAHRLRRKLDAGHAVSLHGRKITLEDVNRALQLVRSAPDFIAERLLAHSVHGVDLGPLKAAISGVESIAFPDPATLLPLPVRNLAFLTPALPRPQSLTGGDPAKSLASVFLPDAAEEQILDL